MSRLANFLAFQVGWFATVWGAGHGAPWAGLVAAALALAIHLRNQPVAQRRGELTLAVRCAAIGFLADTAFIRAGILMPAPWLWSSSWSPPWMVALWVLQATTLNVSLRWMQGRLALASIAGAVAGPLAYAAGARLGAAASLSTRDMIVLGVAWAILFPALLELARQVKKY